MKRSHDALETHPSQRAYREKDSKTPRTYRCAVRGILSPDHTGSCFFFEYRTVKHVEAWKRSGSDMPENSNSMLLATMHNLILDAGT